MKPEHEEWRPYPDCPVYEVSNWGSIRRRRSLRGPLQFVKPTDDGKRLLVTLYIRTETKVRVYTSVARVVAKTFVGPPPTDDHIVHHKDENYYHNWPSNLEYTTRAIHINELHSIRPVNRGRANGNSKLVEHEVQDIRRLAQQGVSQRNIAGIHGVGLCAVQSIISKKTWAWLPEETQCAD